MLPAFLHPEVARDAIATRTPLITPSYLSPEIAAMDAEAKAAGIPILNELGLDPGIDHLSAMEVIDGLRAEGFTLTGFELHGRPCRPGERRQPLALQVHVEPAQRGVGGRGRFGHVQGEWPHSGPATPSVVPRDHGGGCARRRSVPKRTNRDSLAYEQIYGIQGIDTLVRGTLRGDGFCGGWDAVFQLGMNRDDAQVAYPEGTTWREFGRVLRRRAARGRCRGSSRCGGQVHWSR